MRILHVEDSEMDSQYVVDILRREGLGCDIVRVQTKQEFFHEIHGGKFDLILSDCTLPRFSGLEALNLSRTLQPEIPFVFFSGTIGEEAAIESLRNGATDYVLKDRSARLVPSIRRALLDAEQKKAVVELRKSASQRPETGAEELIINGIAHHFNNILTIILGHSDLLAKYCTNPDKVLNTAAAIDGAANRGASIVQKLMTIAGQRDLEFTKVDLNQELRSLCDPSSGRWMSSAKFLLNLDPQLPSLYLDVAQFSQIFDHLIQNSAESMGEGEMVEIKISTFQVAGQSLPAERGLSAENSYLCVQIADAGSGIEEGTLARVFEPFFSTKPKQQGLGLSVVQGLMKAHRGAVVLESKKNGGATATLYFPSLGSASKPREAVPQKLKNLSVAGTETILVVEDEEQLLNFLGIILRGKGYQPILTKDPAQALEVFQTKFPEIPLVITDVGLPQMDGFALIGELKKIHADFRTIVVSGNLESTYRARMDEMDIHHFLAKPYRTNEILQAVRMILDEVKASSTGS